MAFPFQQSYLFILINSICRNIFKFFLHHLTAQNVCSTSVSSLSFKMTCTDRNSYYFPSLLPPSPTVTKEYTCFSKSSLFSSKFFFLNSSSRKNSTAVHDVISYKTNLLGRSVSGRGQVNDISGIIWSFSEICKPTHIKALH